MATKREALIASAEKSVQKGKVDAAIRDYLKVLEETPNDINVLNKVGDLNVRLGKNEESIPFFLRIAEFYARDGFYVRAIAMYKKINKLDPARLDIYEKLAELYVKQQLWMEAKSNYQVLADYLLKQDNLAGAIGIYQKMVAIEPQNLQLHVRLADLFTQAKRIQEALKEYGVVAAALFERGAHDESIRVYEKALRLAPDNVEILGTLVPLLLSINSVDQARGVLRKGLEASPRSVPLFLLSAEAALHANDIAEARSFSDKARAVEPENEEVLAAAVRIQLKGRRPDLAWEAAAPLADAALRRGEARKALAVLVPIARAAPDTEDLVKKVVDIAAGAGDETTALPFRSALAELYRKKGKLAEAADLLRLCARVQPDNPEFRARLAQIEPSITVAPVPPRVPPTTLEKNLEVSVAGFAIPPARPVVPAEPPPVPEPQSPQVAEEFEFDLDDSEMLEEPGPALPEVSPEAPPTPRRGLPVPPRAAWESDARLEAEPAWGSVTAAEALEAFEAREEEARRSTPVPGPPPLEEVEELGSEAELPSAQEALPQEGAFSALDLDLAPPAGFGSGFAFDVGSIPVPSDAPGDLPGVAWPSAALAGPEPLEDEEVAVSFGPLSRPVSGENEIEDALVEADVFRRYGLLEKAVDQLQPLLEKDSENLRIREKLFEIHLEQGHRDEARSHAEILAEAYATTGREDRIRGLEALLGEPLREAPPSEPAAVEPVEEPAVEETAAPEAAAVSEELPVAAMEPVSDSFADLVPEAVAVSEEAPPAVAPWVGTEAFEGPPTEIIGEFVPALSSGPELVPAEEPVAGAEPEPELERRDEEPPVEEALPAHVEDALSVAEAAPEPVETGAPVAAPEPEGEPLLSVEEPTPVPPESAGDSGPTPALDEAPVAGGPEPRALPKERLSAADVLGLGKVPEPSPTKKVRAVTPEDVERQLLGSRRPKAKAKPAAKSDAVLPDDLLQSLRGASPRRAPSADSTRSDTAPPIEPPSAPSAPKPELAPAGGPVDVPAAPGAALSATSDVFDVPVLPAEVEAPRSPSPEELSELDFCLDQGMVVDAAERLQALEGRYPGDSGLVARRLRLEGGRGGSDLPRTALHDILSDDLDSVLDAELGRALTEDMVRESPPASIPVPIPESGAPVLDESGLFSDEQEFFNFADELHTELRREGESAPPEEGREVSLEEIFRDFKKGVEQQLSPEDYETHYNLGIAYKEMGLTDEAIGEFQLAAKDPLHAVECCAMLGLCFLEKGLPQLAVKWYRKGLDTIGIKDEDRLGLQYALAGVLEQVGDRDGAYRVFLEIFGSKASYRDVADRLRELKPFEAS